MSVDVPRLKEKISACHLTPEKLAERIGIDHSTFYRKLKADGLTFTVAQMHAMADVLNLTKDEAIQIFLN